MQTVFFAASLAWAKTGNRMAARIAMMAMTTSSSISVKALRVDFDLYYTGAEYLERIDMRDSELLR